MKKIIGIQSSPRGNASNTLRLLESALEGARAAGAETEIIDVTRARIGYCKGDGACYRTGACIQEDDYAAVRDKIVAAGGIILTSPCYVGNVTAQFKTFIDRSVNLAHEQLLDGKYGFTIATSGSPDPGYVNLCMNEFIRGAGGRTTGEVYVALSHGPAAMGEAIKKAYDMGRDLMTAIEEKRAYPEQTAAHRAWKKQFGRIIVLNREPWAHNYDHWVKNGWIKEDIDPSFVE